MSAHRPLLLAALFSLAACANRSESQPPLRYPAMPQGATASTEAAAFEPAALLKPLSIACRSGELTPQNALDDDCDGRIDAAPADAELVIAVAYPRGSALAVALGNADSALPIPPDPCADPQSFCTARIDAAALPRGRKSLFVKAREGVAADQRTKLVVSVQTRAGVNTYIADLDGAEHTLGQVALP